MANTRSFPLFDPRIEHVSLSRVRELNVLALQRLEKALIVKDAGLCAGKPLAVIIPFDMFMQAQDIMISLEDENVMLKDKIVTITGEKHDGSL